MYTVTEKTITRSNGEMKCIQKVVCYLNVVNKTTLDDLTDALYEIHNVYIREIISLGNNRYELRTEDKYFFFVIEAVLTLNEMLEEYREFAILNAD